MKYVSFDIETYGSVEKPEGVTCAATLTELGELKIWKPDEGSDGRYKPRMSVGDIGEMVYYLMDQYEVRKRPPLAFNGLSFDFRVLYEQCAEDTALQGRIKSLALVQIETALHFLSEKGFMVGLNAMSKAMGASGKMEGMDGQKAAELWMTGTRSDQETILEYVAQDVVTTREIYDSILKFRQVNWVKRNGGVGTWIPSTRSILCAKEVIERGFVGKPHWWTGGEWPWTKESVLGWLDE